MFGCCKTFSGKYIFFGNANFRKRKIFPCVWLHFKKFSGKYFLVFRKEEGKHKSKKTQVTTQEKIINDDTEHRPTTAVLIAIDGTIAISRSTTRSRSSRVHAVDRDLGSVRSREGEIVIFARTRLMARSRSSRDRVVDRDLAKARSRSTASRDCGLEIAINDGAGSRTRTGDRDQRRRDRRLEIAISRARALSLCLIFWKHFEGKIEV